MITRPEPIKGKGPGPLSRKYTLMEYNYQGDRFGEHHLIHLKHSQVLELYAATDKSHGSSEGCAQP